MRMKTSCTVVGLAAWSADAPWGPISSRVGELTGPASMRKPASRTPSTSATFMAVTPLSGMIVASPRPSTMVFARLTLIVRSTW